MDKKMYVFFDENGAILSIDPSKETDLADVRVAEVSVTEVIPFLQGTKNVHRYLIVEDVATGKFRFVSKETSSHNITTLNTYLSEVTSEYHNDYDIILEHDVRRKSVRVALAGDDRPKGNTDKLKVLIANFTKLTFYFTMNGDPNMLLCAFDVPVNDLKDREVFVNLEHHGDELNNATLFTKKILTKHHYRKLQYT